MEKSKKFTIRGKQFVAKFPNVGQIIDLDAMKQALSSNRYANMASSGLVSAYFALDLIDTIAFYQVVVPEVGKYFDIKNYAEMDLSEAKDLIDAYKEQIQPWYLETMNEIRGVAAQSVEDAGKSKSDS